MGTDAADASTESRPSHELAYWLRDLRRASGESFESLSRRTGYSRTVLADACSGRRPVSLPVLEALVAACGGDVEAWREYWRVTRRRIDAGDLPGPRSAFAPPWHAGPDSDEAPTDGGSVAVDEQADAAGGTGRALEVDPTARAGRSPRRRWLALSAAALVVVVGAGVWLVLGPSSASSDQLFEERQFNRNGGPTFRDAAGVADPGDKIPFGKVVLVSCKILEPSIPSVSPDGYWYRIETAPWNGEYYAAANTFLNDDPEEGPYTHNTDFAVPDCPAP